jgi:hypothetical protein
LVLHNNTVDLQLISESFYFLSIFLEKCTNREKIQKLVKTGRDALQLYFDTQFPQKDLDKCLQDNKKFLCKGNYRFNEKEIEIVYPKGGVL